jgi:hypothetical protein
VFDFLSNQILSIAATRRAGGADTPSAENRQPAEREMPRALTARAASTEDQVFLSSAARVPPAALPVKPSEPTETGNRVRDALRRLRGFGRRSARTDRQDPDPEDHDASDPPPDHHRFDRLA